jgi:hypothetical protein
VKQWKKTLMVFRTTMLMCLAGNPNQAKLKLSKESLHGFYDWIYGNEIMTRSPAPSLKVLMTAERKAWRKISIMLHEGSTLQSAIDDLRHDHMFWLLETYELVDRGKGAGDHFNDRSRSRSRDPYQGGDQWWKPKSNPWAPNGLGKGNGKDRRKVREIRQWQGHWAIYDPNGKMYCKKHLVYQKCQGKCGKSHNCPRFKDDGAACDADHLPGPDCPHHRMPAAAETAPAPRLTKQWATCYPAGKFYCNNFLYDFNCRGKCGRSHKCPIMKADGTACDADHVPGPGCPHY